MGRRLWPMVVALCAAGSVFTVSGTGAQAQEPELAQVVLATSLPGLTAAPPGPTNGPFTSSTSSLLGASPALAGVINQQLAAGTLSGYLRIWPQQPPAGDDAAVLAFRLSDPSQTPSFLYGVNRGVESDGPTGVPVSQIAGARGFELERPIDGRPLTEYTITFAKGDTVFMVETATLTGDLAFSDDLKLAVRQAANAPGSAVTPTADATSGIALNFDEVLGSVAVAAIVVLLIVRHQRRRTTSPPLGPSRPTSGFTPIPPSTPEPVAPPGWYPLAGNPYEQRFWDGTTWSASVRWDGTTWVQAAPASVG